MLFQVIPENITDSDETFVDIAWQDFIDGDHFYILALKSQNYSGDTDFLVEFDINLIELYKFSWVPSNIDKVFMIAAPLILAALLIYSGMVAFRARLLRLRKAGNKLQMKKVKKPKQKKQKKKKSHFLNPYLNLPNSGS